MPRKVLAITYALLAALAIHLAALWGYALLQPAPSLNPGSAGVHVALGPANQKDAEEDDQTDLPDSAAERPPEPVVEELPPEKPFVPVRKKPPQPVQKKEPSRSSAQAGATATGAGQAEAQNRPVDGTGQVDAQKAYLSTLAAWLAKHRRYPAGARRRGQEGVVRVRVTISRSGQVLAQEIIESSGYFLLDREAMATVKRAQPLPAFPPELKGPALEFNLPVRFGLNID